MLKDDILNLLNFQQRYCLHIVVKRWSTIRAVVWRTVHEHIVADALHSKNNSALLLHEQQDHKSDAF